MWLKYKLMAEDINKVKYLYAHNIWDFIILSTRRVTNFPKLYNHLYEKIFSSIFFSAYRPNPMSNQYF